MNILVTGCAGFIGSHLSERLISEGHEVIGLDNFDAFYDKSIKLENLKLLQQSSNFKLLEIDLRDSKKVLAIEEDFDVIVHLAAKAGVRPSIQMPSDYIDVNIKGTQHLLSLMLKKGKNKMIFASSSSVYGDSTPAPYNEGAVVDFPISPYAFTKKACELMLYTYFHLYRISSVSLRFFTVYGPRQRPDLAINKFFKAVEQDKPITVFGDGSTARDYTFIEDIINGIMRSIQYVVDKDEVYEVVNLGNRNPTLLLDLIHAIEKTVGKKARLQFEPMQPGDVLLTCADTQKASDLLGFKAQTSMEQGLAAYYSWLQSSLK